MRLVIVEKTEKHCAPAGVRRIEPPRKSPSPIRAAERFRPLNKLMVVESVRKIKMRLKRGQWLSRKWRNTVHMQQLSTCHWNYQFSQQLLTVFESRFDFPDRLNTHEPIQRPKTFRRTNRRRRFLRRLSSCYVTASAQWFYTFSATATSFKPWLDFWDQDNTFNHMQRTKTLFRANRSRRFWITITWEKSWIVNSLM